MTIFRWLLAICVLMPAVALAQAERVELAKPVRVQAVKLDKSRISGAVIAFDGQGFEIRNLGGEVSTIAWSDLDAKNIHAVYSRLIENGMPEQWCDLGELLWHTEGGQTLAERCFTRATKADESLKERVEAIKSTEPGPAEPDEEKEGDDEERRGGDGDSGPITVGRTQNEFWGELSDEVMAASVKELKEFAEETKKKVNSSLQLHETKYFLFYSDLKKADAEKWAGLLDKMYARLCEMFGIGKGVNVWRGKALVFVFRNSNDYHEFQAVMHGTDSSGSAGMCHGYGNGYVHIAFYRQDSETEFAHVLVHESVHGFLHRYRSPVHIPSWLNEGLAEVLSAELVPRAGRQITIRQKARNLIQEAGGLRRSYLETRQIQAWQYPVSEALTALMIKSNRKGYVKYINAIKDGEPWDEAMEKHYGLKPDELLKGLQRDLGVRD
jgi:hypothetical protein